MTRRYDIPLTARTCPQHPACIRFEQEGEPHEHHPARKVAVEPDAAFNRARLTQTQANDIAKMLNESATALMGAVDQASAVLRETRELHRDLTEAIEVAGYRIQGAGKAAVQRVQTATEAAEARIKALEETSHVRLVKAESVAREGAREASKRLQAAEAGLLGTYARVERKVSQWRASLQDEADNALQKARAALANSEEWVAALKADGETYAERIRQLVRSAREEIANGGV